MHIVIEIPDAMYEDIESGKYGYSNYVHTAIVNGTPLPKGHGDLVDRDEINGRFYDIWKELESYSDKPSQKELLDRWSMCMDTAPTIIEADEESEE